MTASHSMPPSSPAATKNFIEDLRRSPGTGTATNPVVFQSVNLSNVRINGFEAKGDVTWAQWGSTRFSTPFAYGRTNGKNTATSQPLNSIDPEKLYLAFRFDTPTWDVRLGMTHRRAKDASDVDNASLLTAPAVQFAPPSCV